MPMNRNNPVYQPTTASLPREQHADYAKQGYLSRLSRPPGCCYGRRKRLSQWSALVLASLLVLSGVVLLVLAVGSGGGGGLIFAVLLSLLLFALATLLVVFYLRTQGRCDLACWPNRSAQLSRSLAETSTQVTIAGATAADDDEYQARTRAAAVAARTSALASDAATGGDERSKLMEEDNLDADKIAESQPKIVLMN